MKRFIQKLREMWSIKELRERIIFTLALLAIYRLGSQIVLPGLVASKMSAAAAQNNGLLGLINTFTGGAFLGGSILALGIMPYISASIFMQLLTFAVPQFMKMQQEGESGQRKINQLTRILAVVITLFQAFAYLTYIRGQYASALSPSVSEATFRIVNMFVITGGTILCMWLGERITDRGIGNGTSLIIAIGIVARLPRAILAELNGRFQGNGGLIVFAVEIAALILVTIGTIMLIQAVRKIPLQYARAATARGQRYVPGTDSNFPVKLNAAGVMPIIFAQALMFLPALFVGLMANEQANGSIGVFSDIRSIPYNAVYFILIILFTYVYTALIINPQQNADYLKRSNAFIPGVKPGIDTANFIDAVATRITLPGAVGLGIVAILPTFAMWIGINDSFAYFYGGTSLIIMVGVVLDTLQKVEGYLLEKQYDGLIKGARIQGRTTFSGQTVEQ